MKNKRKLTIVIEQDEDGFYVATVPALRACHTQARRLDTLMNRIREAIAFCLEEGSDQNWVWVAQRFSAAVDQSR